MLKGCLEKRKIHIQDIVGFLKQTKKKGKSGDNSKEQLVLREPQLGRQKLNLAFRDKLKQHAVKLAWVMKEGPVSPPTPNGNWAQYLRM